jgi:hypothetical protein
MNESIPSSENREPKEIFKQALESYKDQARVALTAGDQAAHDRAVVNFLESMKSVADRALEEVQGEFGDMDPQRFDQGGRDPAYLRKGTDPHYTGR